MNEDLFEVVTEYIKNDALLDEETRGKYLGLVGSLKAGERVDEVGASELMGYLDEIFKVMEDEAVAKEDSEGIAQLAHLREERNKMMESVLPSESPPSDQVN